MIAEFSPCILSGEIQAPPSKSMAHRYLIGAALCGQECTLSGVDFSEDIYGSELELVFFRKLRDEMRFSGPEELVAQLAADREARRACGLEGDFRERC